MITEIQSKYMELVHRIDREQLQKLAKTEAAKFLELYINNLLKYYQNTEDAYNEIFNVLMSFTKCNHLEEYLERLKELLANPQTFGDVVEIHLLLFFMITQEVSQKGNKDQVSAAMYELQNMLSEERKIEQMNEEYDKFAYKFKR